MRRGGFAVGVPLLWAIGGLAVLGMVGLSGIAVSSAFTNYVLQDTYYVVVHWRPAIGVAAVFGVFAGWYYLFPRVTGWAYSTLLGKLHFWLTFTGVSASIIAIGFGPQVLMLAYGPGMIDVPDAFHYVNLVSLTASYAAAAGTLVFFINMALAFWRRRPAPVP
jgi:cytochrome c oxidase subunit 1